LPARWAPQAHFHRPPSAGKAWCQRLKSNRPPESTEEQPSRSHSEGFSWRLLRSYLVPGVINPPGPIGSSSGSSVLFCAAGGGGGVVAGAWAEFPDAPRAFFSASASCCQTDCPPEGESPR